MNLGELKDLLNIEILFGDVETSIEGVSTVNCIIKKSFFFISSPRFLKKYLETEVNFTHGVIASKELLLNENQEISKLKEKCLWLGECEDINHCMVKTSKIFHDHFFDGFNWVENFASNYIKRSDVNISNDVFIGPDVEIKENVTLMSGVKILGRNIIRENTIVFPNVTLYPNVNIGKNGRIHSNTVVGSDGFGYKFLEGEHQKIWHYGGVEIHDNVEIGSGTCIDGGTFSPTIIGEGCKIDNHVQVAHNTILGKKVILCGKVGLSGSCKIGDYTILAGGAGMAPECELGVGCKVGGGAQVNKSWPDGSTIIGYPAINSRDWKRSTIRFQQLNKSK